MAWQRGEAVVRREVWRGRPWMGAVVRVVADEPGLLATYLPAGTPFAFPDGEWPGGRHPWHGRGAWEGHGILMLHRPRDRYAVVHFWDGPERRFAGWYLNLQEPFRRTAASFDTLDLELDIWLPVDGPVVLKDWDLLDERVAEGRFTTAEAGEIRAEGSRLAAALEEGERWWDGAWAGWTPDPAWVAVPPPEGWELLDGRALATERLLLRPLAERDRGWLGALYTRAGDSPDGAGREIDGALVHWREEGFGHYVATLRETGAPAGVIELHRAGAGLTGIEPDEVEIGWVVEPELRGRGLATEGAAAVGAHALGALGLDHVVAYIRLENHASARVAETAGLRRRGPGRARNGDPVEVWELRRGGAR